MSCHISQPPDYTIELRFEGSNAGTMDYDISSEGQAGDIPIQRITLDSVPAWERI